MKSLLMTCVACALLVGLVAGRATAADDKQPDQKRAKKDEKAKPVNTTCPLTGEKIDPVVTTQYKGKTVAFCCEDCIKDFKKDPDKYMKKIEAEQAKARKEGEKKDEKKDEKKGEQPSAAGKPVNKFCAIEQENEVDPTVTTTYKGKTVGFCCEDCIKKFQANPDAYMAKLK